MVSITHALRQVKDDLAGALSRRVIEGICSNQGHRWRCRQLDPVSTIYLFLAQILNGNVACGSLPHLANQRFTASAYCQARMRLPVDVLKALVHRVGSTMRGLADQTASWHGHRIFHIDGTGFSMPDTPALQRQFGQPSGQRTGCGFPVAHMLALCDAASGMILDAIVSPWRTHDMSGSARLHPRLRPNDVLVGDRAFCSYAHFALILLNELHAVFRVHQRQIVDFRPHRRARQQVPKDQRKGKPTSVFVRRLARHDQIVQWVKPEAAPAWMSAEAFASLPETILVRELRYHVRQRGFRTRAVTLATTLLDADVYSVKELADVYHQRWQIEVNFRHLKQTMGMDVLRCKTVDGVMKELWMFVLAYNLVCMVMLKAARRQQVPPNRISFTDALRWLCHARWGQPMRELQVNPHRPHRIEPRVVKRRPKQYKLMKQPRDKLRKLLKKQRVTA